MIRGLFYFPSPAESMIAQKSSPEMKLPRRILLVGNPNVGKSIFFSRLTGVRVISSNYPGTTVGVTRGFLKVNDRLVEVIDVPGTYSLDPSSEAEEVAAKILRESDPAEVLIINVVDSTNLERNLRLTLDLIELGIPMIVALNIWDETRHRGIEIDLKELESRLGLPLVPTVATSGEGFRELRRRITEAASPGLPAEVPDGDPDSKWAYIGRLTRGVQRITHRHHTFRDRLEEWSVKPITGIITAAVVIFTSFHLIRFIGEGLIGYVLDPLFQNVGSPLLLALSASLGGEGVLHEILIGTLFDGEIDFVQSFGVLSTGLYVPLAMVLPYIISFYLVLGLLEDFGYLPRLATLLDTMMHRIGLHGYAIIPNLLGLGCNVPAILSTRILESARERFIAAALISIGVPCAALQAMIFGLVGSQGGQYVFAIYASLFFVWLVIGYVLNRTLPGFSPELLIEIPPYRIPPLGAVFQKLWYRIIGFLREALPIVIIGVGIVNILYIFKVFDTIASLAAPVVKGVWGLPEEAITAIMIGFLRKDVAVGMLAPLGLSPGQLVIACTVLAMSFPCIATFIILIRELGWKGLLKVVILMIVTSVIVGGIQNMIF